MKRIACLSLLLMMLLALVLGCAGTQEKYEQSTVPFSVDDVTNILNGLTTVGDYVSALEPTNYSWFFIGEATGETQLTLNNPDGSVSLRFTTKDGTINGAAEGEAEELPEEILGLWATVTAIEWLSANFTAIPTVRGISIGASHERVLSGYLRRDDTQMYTIEDINENAGADWIADWAFVGGRFIEKGGFYDYDTLEYGWCELTGPNVWKEYYNLFYDLDGEKVHSIRLYIEGDEE